LLGRINPVRPLEGFKKMQASLAFPIPLTDKYRPTRIAEFAGLDKQKRILTKFAATPYPSAWLFVGASGTGKTSMAFALAAEIGAEVHHVPAKEMDLARVQEIARLCNYIPLSGPSGFHMVICDEVDSMSEGAALAWLSKLDAAAPLPNTIVCFTCNDTARLEKRFLSRCRVLEFSSYGMSAAIADLLQNIWDAETDNATERPNFARMAKDAGNNLRDALMSLELEIMAA
jgi:replication-associated recombination protein RarA